jgi:HSP20 family protein
MVRRRRSSFFGDDFDFPGFGGFEDFDEIFERLFGESFEDIEKQVKTDKPFVKGISIKIGPDGKPQVREFGNSLQPGKQDVREPLVDVIDCGKEVRVIAELPGVDKQHVNLSVSGDVLDLSVLDPQRKFARQIKLPAEVSEKDVKATLKNGILEICLKKTGAKAKGSKIKVD